MTATRLLAAAWFAFLSLATNAAAQGGTPLVAGTEYEGPMIACHDKAEAEHVFDLAASDRAPEAKAFMEADGNTCGAGDMVFTVLAQVGATRSDKAGHQWKLLSIHTRIGDLFMLTTSEFTAADGGKT